MQRATQAPELLHQPSAHEWLGLQGVPAAAANETDSFDFMTARPTDWPKSIQHDHHALRAGSASPSAASTISRISPRSPPVESQMEALARTSLSLLSLVTGSRGYTDQILLSLAGSAFCNIP